MSAGGPPPRPRRPGPPAAASAARLPPPALDRPARAAACAARRQSVGFPVASARATRRSARRRQEDAGASRVGFNGIALGVLRSGTRFWPDGSRLPVSQFACARLGGYTIEHHPGRGRQRQGAHDHARLAPLGRRRRRAARWSSSTFTLAFNFVTLNGRRPRSIRGLPTIVLADQREEAAARPGARAGPPQRDGRAPGRAAGADAAPRERRRAARAHRGPEAAGAAEHGQPVPRAGRRHRRRCRRAT